MADENDVFWLYEITVGEGVYQGCRGKNAEDIMRKVVDGIDEAGEPFRAVLATSKDAEVAELVDALAWVIKKIDAEICTHEETYRGGAIWTICRGCGMKWADDRGGFKAYREPPQLTAARDALAKHKDTP